MANESHIETLETMLETQEQLIKIHGLFSPEEVEFNKECIEALKWALNELRNDK